MNLVDEYTKHLITKVQDLIGKKEHLSQFIERKIPRIDFDEAEKILGGEGIERYETWRSLTSLGEQKLVEHFGGPVWITKFDEDAVPFYQRTENGKAKNADLLMGIGETVGCGERWSGYDELKLALEHHKVDQKEYEWYIEMKKNFPFRTSGFGMGVERFLLFILQKDDIREMQVFRRFGDGKDVV